EGERYEAIVSNGKGEFSVTAPNRGGERLMLRAIACGSDSDVDMYGFGNDGAGMGVDASVLLLASGNPIYTLRLEAAAHGKFIDSSGAKVEIINVEQGGSATIMIAADDKYSLATVSIDNVVSSVAYKFTISNVLKDQVIAASFTNFPTIFINTENNLAVTSKDVYLKAAIQVEQNFLTPLNEQSVKRTEGIEIKGRGNSTWSYAKKPYRLKFSSSNSQAYLGMGLARNWVLLANWIDPSHMRNDVAFEIGRRLGLPFTKKTRHVRLIFNGRYDGLYQLTSHNEVRENSNAVDINKSDWYAEFDTYKDEYIHTTPVYKRPMKFKQPEIVSVTSNSYFTTPDWSAIDPSTGKVYNSATTKKYWTAATEQIAKFENDLKNNVNLGNLGRPDLGYEDNINVSTFIDWLLVHMIAGNYEPKHPKSSYFHINTKSGNGKITAGNLWDFDWAFGY
ncbi:MAG: CotH kinase family protein, partial [Lentisphaeria bacterium]